MTISELRVANPGYLAHMMATTQGTLLETYPRLKDALRAEGLLDDLVCNLSEKIKVLYEKSLARAERDLADAASLHPEVKRLRKLEQIKSSRVLAGLGKTEEALSLGRSSEPLAMPLPGPKRSRMLSLAKLLVPHCETCGAIAHKKRTCPYKGYGRQWYSRTHTPGDGVRARQEARQGVVTFAIHSDLCAEMVIRA